MASDEYRPGFIFPPAITQDQTRTLKRELVSLGLDLFVTNPFVSEEERGAIITDLHEKRQTGKATKVVRSQLDLDLRKQEALQIGLQAYMQTRDEIFNGSLVLMGHVITCLGFPLTPENVSYASDGLGEVVDAYDYTRVSPHGGFISLGTLLTLPIRRRLIRRWQVDEPLWMGGRVPSVAEAAEIAKNGTGDLPHSFCTSRRVYSLEEQVAEPGEDNKGRSYHDLVEDRSQQGPLDILHRLERKEQFSQVMRAILEVLTLDTSDSTLAHQNYIVRGLFRIGKKSKRQPQPKKKKQR